MAMMQDSIANALMQWTAAHSGFETSRNYISMSHAALPLEEIIDTIDRGFDDTLRIRLKCYKGYQMEIDLLKRLAATCKEVEIPTDLEVSAFDGVVKGHPDFLFRRLPSDCKSVPLEAYLPAVAGMLSKKIKYQMEAYMMYGKKQRALVIMEARDTGLIREYWLQPDTRRQHEIHDKFTKAVAYWNQKLRHAKAS